MALINGVGNGCRPDVRPMLNVEAIIVSKMTIHCAGTVQIRKETERGIRK